MYDRYVCLTPIRLDKVSQKKCHIYCSSCTNISCWCKMKFGSSLIPYKVWCLYVDRHFLYHKLDWIKVNFYMLIVIGFTFYHCDLEIFTRQWIYNCDGCFLVIIFLLSTEESATIKFKWASIPFYILIYVGQSNDFLSLLKPAPCWVPLIIWFKIKCCDGYIYSM